MIFGNKSLRVHLVRGAVGFGALSLSLATVNQIWWPTLFLVPLAFWMLKGCPICWTAGLFETLANWIHRRFDSSDL